MPSSNPSSRVSKRASRASLEAKRVEALDALLAERIRTYNEHRLHSSLRSKTPKKRSKKP
ncbi:integrase core domain-containing protein [Hydrogenibacillus schlegelii]|uniref:integrase core domain-containing protein n=1 Tax=Hydrogenibacillus schlegelii TaxID=1484 RepID=UPI003C6D3B8E